MSGSHLGEWSVVTFAQRYHHSHPILISNGKLYFLIFQVSILELSKTKQNIFFLSPCSTWSKSVSSQNFWPNLRKSWNIFLVFVIGPRSDHCLPLSLTHWLTPVGLVDLMPVNNAHCLVMSQQLLIAAQLTPNPTKHSKLTYAMT